MCGRTVVARSIGELVTLFDIDDVIGEQPGITYNNPPSLPASIVVDRVLKENEGDHAGELRRQLHAARWGLIPRNSQGPQNTPLHNNARIETVLQKPTFRNAVLRQHCVMPVSGYYEWQIKEMVQLDAGAILDIAIAGTSGTLLAAKWESPLLVNVDNETLSKVLSNKKALDAIMKIEGFRKLGDNPLALIINKSEDVKKKKKTSTSKDKQKLSKEEKEYRSLRKQIQEKLTKFAGRIPVFMYLTDYRENSLTDVIRKIEPELFKTVTGLTVEDFDLLVSLNVFNAHHINQGIFAFRRYEDSSLSYSGIESHENLRKIGLFNTVLESSE